MQKHERWGYFWRSTIPNWFQFFALWEKIQSDRNFLEVPIRQVEELAVKETKMQWLLLRLQAKTAALKARWNFLWDQKSIRINKFLRASFCSICHRTILQGMLLLQREMQLELPMQLIPCSSVTFPLPRQEERLWIAMPVCCKKCVLQRLNL